MGFQQNISKGMTANQHFEALDWLRGLMAFSIMFYHYTSWFIKPMDSSSLIGRLGIYGVSIFYILSGLNLAIAYNKRINNFKAIQSFILRRVFRILPLLWLATILYLIVHEIPQYYLPPPSLEILFLNFTALFGFVSPKSYILIGAWSIGNELVFYSMFPLIIYMYNKRLSIGNILFVIVVIVEIVFSFFILTPNKTLGSQWTTYINPFNQLFLFVLGVATYYNFNKLKNNNLINILGLLSILLFIFYPVSGDQIYLSTGFNRFFFSIWCCIVVLMFWKMKISPPIFLKQLLNTIGASTYSIYLLHQTVILVVKLFMDKIGYSNVYILITASVITTIILSSYVYRYYEKPFIKLGKSISQF